MSAQTVETTRAAVLGDLHYSTMPTDLRPWEATAYNKGWTRTERAFLKANGGPGVIHDGEAPKPGTLAHKRLAKQLAEQGREYRIARHEKCHRGGMSALRSHLRKRGEIDRLAEIIDPMAPAKVSKPRKLAAVKPVAPVETPDVVAAAIDSGRMVVASVPRVDPAPETVPAPMPPMTRAARKATRREIAATMRAEGLTPSGPEWYARCAAAGLPVAHEGADAQ